MPNTSYAGDTYLDYPQVEAVCRELVARHPDWVALDVVGHSRHGRPLLLLTIGAAGDRDERPGFWLDGGTHAPELTGVMSALYSAARWVEGLAAGDAELVAWFSDQTAYVMPCISPDGFQAIMEGAPFLRSTLRPPPPGVVRQGFQPRDIDGDGRVRWMRWRHPAGAWVDTAEAPHVPRPRTVDDDPSDAYFLASEGEFIEWDGVTWTAAPREHGLDLNRNFPGSWRRFTMFGMDGGDYPLSEPESRAVVEAFRGRRRIAAAVTNHTYTGCILTQPYRKDTPLAEPDIRLMESLATQAVEGTGYRVIRTYPDFMYDPNKAIVGVWADTLSTTFGVPGYTLELWDPYARVGEQIDKPVEFFRRPDPDVLCRLLQTWAAGADTWSPWRPFDHPQLGPVEVGGLEYLRTVRNPPEQELAAECAKGHAVADRVRRSLPRVHAELRVETCADGLREVTLVLENVGFLPTSGLALAESIGTAPAPFAALELDDGASVVRGSTTQVLEHMDGWGQLQVSSANLIYADLPDRGHRAVARWLVRGDGAITAMWDAGRGGRGRLTE